MRLPRRAVLPDPWSPMEPYLRARSIIQASSALAAGTVVAANNDAHYIPVVFPCDAVLYAMYFAAANGIGNYDLGLYRADLTRIASTGSTAMSAAGVKTLSLANIRVEGGETYYSALALSSTTGQIIRPNFTLGALEGVGWGYEASALPLPATATPISVTAYTVIPWFAFGVR